MKSDLFIKKYIEKQKKHYYPDSLITGDPSDPYEHILSDLEKLRLTELVLSSKTFKELIKNLKTVNYWEIDGVLTINSEIIRKLEEFVFNVENSLWKIKFQNSLKEIPSDYGIRGKAAELMLLMQ